LFFVLSCRGFKPPDKEYGALTKELAVHLKSCVPLPYTYFSLQITAHFPIVSFSVHGLELSGRFSLMGGLILRAVLNSKPPAISFCDKESPSLNIKKLPWIEHAPQPSLIGKLIL
jgi:hypothetical protein